MTRNQPYRKIHKNEIVWTVLDEYSSFIPGELVEKIRDLNSSPECFVIRENNVRVSLFITLPENKEVIFVKRYKCRGFMDIIKYFFFTSKASSEWKNMNRFLEKGIPVAIPISKGEKRRFNCLLDSYIVTKALVNARPLHSFVKECLDVRKASDALLKRKLLIKKLALLVQKIHGEGFFYRDLHAGNILVLENNSDDPQLYPIDFHKVWCLKKVPIWMRIRDLAQLKNSLSASRTDQMRFLHEYAKGCPSFLSNFNINARRVERKADKLWRVHLKSRTKRCLIESSEFAVKRNRTQSLYYNKGYSEKFITDIIKAYHNTLANGKHKVLKNTPKEIVSVVTINHDGKELKVLVKESKYQGLLSRLRYILYKSRARRYWFAARGLKVRGIATTGALALIEKRKLSIPSQNILLTEFINHSFELNDYVLKNFKKTLSPSEVFKKMQFVKEFAHKLRDLHEKGIYHADLKSNNILVKEKEEGGWTFYFVDLDRVTFKHQLSFRQRSNNLAQINASIADCIGLSDRLRFFRTYSCGTPVIKQRKRYYRRILEISRKKITQPYGITFSSEA
jgi:tRNA A-37 threonylcarbamoyl transferase component Bud32